jgi:hypothetical protein
LIVLAGELIHPEHEEVPMDRLTRHAALSAAAKVALSMSALGCASTVIERAAGTGSTGQGGASSGATAGTTITGTASAGTTTTASSAAGAGGAGGSSTVCDAPPSGADASVGSAVFDCCVAFLEPDASLPGGSFDPSAANDPRVVDCCQAIVAHVDQNYSDYSKVPYQELGACCTLLNNPVGPACTPWGPPVPPAMPAAWIEEVA